MGGQRKERPEQTPQVTFQQPAYAPGEGSNPADYHPTNVAPPGVGIAPATPAPSSETIVPDLAESWAWDPGKTKLTFKLRQGVKWHDGKPFTAKDVQCTWDKLTGKAKDDFRRNPRAIWWHNLANVTVEGDHAVTFHLKRPQPSFIALLASGWSPIYPCHVPAAQMRTKPVGTGPFKFVELRVNELIKLAKNPDYWKQGLPYLDGIEWKIIPSRSTRMLAFVNGDFDMTHPTDVSVPLLKDVRQQAPKAQCKMRNSNVRVALVIINHNKVAANVRVAVETLTVAVVIKGVEVATRVGAVITAWFLNVKTSRSTKKSETSVAIRLARTAATTCVGASAVRTQRNPARLPIGKRPTVAPGAR